MNSSLLPSSTNFDLFQKRPKKETQEEPSDEERPKKLRKIWATVESTGDVVELDVEQVCRHGKVGLSKYRKSLVVENS